MTAAARPAVPPYPSEGPRSEDETAYRHLERVLSSEQFRRAPSLRGLLKYVVVTALEGRSAELKEYTLGAEGLGRGNDFDPRVDPIVRVQMHKIRNRLARYYAEQPPDDGVRFEIPKGRYVPRFVGPGGRSPDGAEVMGPPRRVPTAMRAAPQEARLACV